MIVAIDGPAGSGKTTIAREIARRMGFEKLDTGALYRTVAFACTLHGVDLDDEDGVVALSRSLDISFDSAGEATRISVDGRDVSDDIRTPAVDRIVSKVSAYPGVREAMLPVQRLFAQDRDVVAEGRDIGTVVFPNALVKVFLTADPRERARRRVLQRHPGEQLSDEALQREVEETLADLERRDRLDSSREAAPLRAADDAVRIDSSRFTIDEVVDQIRDLISKRRDS